MQEHDDLNDTDYLLNNPVNATCLDEAIDEVEAMIAKKSKEKQLF